MLYSTSNFEKEAQKYANKKSKDITSSAERTTPSSCLLQ